MDKNTKNLLCGLVLGDGTVHKRGKRFQMQHSIKQLEYLKYKVSLLKEVGFNLEIQTFECNGYQECRCGFSNDYFTRIRKWLYKTGKKVIKKEFLLRLTDREIAIWMMEVCINIKANPESLEIAMNFVQQPTVIQKNKPLT